MVTAGDLLAEEPLREAEIIGGERGLDAPVHHVALTVTGTESAAAPYGTAMVLDLGGVAAAARRQHLAEIVARRLHARGGRLVVVAGGAFTAALSTRRLADRLELPIVSAPDAVPVALTARLLSVVHAPDVAAGHRLVAAAGSLGRVLEILDAELDGCTSVTTGDGTVLAGTAPPHAFAIPLSGPVPAADRTGRVSTAVCPVPGAAGEASLWIISQSARSGPLWRDVALGLLDLAAAQRLAAERDARVRGALLADILHLAGPPPPHVAGQAARLGWRLDGWHTGIEIALTAPALPGPAGPAPPAPATLTPLLAARLAAHGVAAPLIERAGGWSAWDTRERRPAGTSRLAVTVRQALGDYHATANVPPIVAGIGRPATGPAGLATTLAEARRAALVAVASRRPGAVLRGDELGAKQMLLDYYGSAAARAEAERMLAPLLREDDPALLETLEGYLDCGCSSSTAATLVFQQKLCLRFGKQVSGGAGYCLSDVYKDNAKNNMQVQTLFATTQKKMPTDRDHVGWAPWKLRLWNACAFGLSLTKEEGGVAFLIPNFTPLVTGQRYYPESDNHRLNPVWKKMDGAEATFVKVNLVKEGASELARIQYATGEPTTENVDSLYGAVIQKLNEIAG